MRITAICTAVIMLLSCLMLPALADDVPSASRDTFAMDTYMTITCYGDECEEALNDAISEILRLDQLLSIGQENSEIATLNRNGSGVLSEDSAAMVSKALEIYDLTGGAFDITILPMMELWGFTTQNFYVPTDEELRETLQLVGSDQLTWDAETRTLTLGEGQGIDLGGIAKGFTSDRLTEIFAEHGLTSALVSLGGNVHCYQTKPDGSHWRVGIQSPHDTTQIIGVVNVVDKCVITSGGYERYFTDDETGKTYHHIIDPSTGYPAESGLISVSIVSDSGILADALSTSLFIMGLDKAAEYWRTSEEPFDMILVTDNDEIYISEGLKDDFTTNLPLKVITK